MRLGDAFEVVATATTAAGTGATVTGSGSQGSKLRANTEEFTQCLEINNYVGRLLHGLMPRAGRRTDGDLSHLGFRSTTC